MLFRESRILHVFGDDFLIADAVLHGAHRAGIVKKMRGIGNGRARVRAFGGHQAVIAAWNFLCAVRGVQARGEIRRAGEPQAAA